MPAAQQTEGQWTGQAQTKGPLQIPGISPSLSPLVTMASFSARAQLSTVSLQCDLLDLQEYLDIKLMVSLRFCSPNSDSTFGRTLFALN